MYVYGDSLKEFTVFLEHCIAPRDQYILEVKVIVNNICN